MQTQTKASHQHAQLRLPSHLWILLCMFLISIAPTSCSGACADTSGSISPTVCTIATTILPVFSPQSKPELQSAVDACLAISTKGNSSGSRPIQDWLHALHLVMTQPGLLDGLPGGAAPLMEQDDPRLRELLRVTAEDPSDLLKLLDTRGHRIGIAFESLIQWGLEVGLGYRCLARNVQIVEDKRTVGALDLILVSPEGKTEHWELAYKLFLQVDSGKGWDSWLGPYGRDWLNTKVNRMLEHQLPMSSRAAASEVLGDLGVDSISVRRIVLQGVLFTPWSSAPIQATQGHQPAQGRWVRASRVNELVGTCSGSTWVQRHTPFWPWGGTRTAGLALSGEQLYQQIRSATFNRSQLWSRLGSDAHTDEQLFFIVPEDWGV